MESYMTSRYNYKKKKKEIMKKEKKENRIGESFSLEKLRRLLRRKCKREKVKKRCE